MNLTLMISAVVLLAPLPDRTGKPGESGPTLVTKSKEYLVHVIPAAKLGDDLLDRYLPGGLQVVHTSAETGKMNVLVATGSWSIPTRRQSFGQTRIVGISADAERLYVAEWTSGRVWDRPPPPATETTKGGVYHLHVFWLADGSRIAERELAGAGLPENVPVEMAGKGALSLMEKGVSCYGASFEFKGKELVKPAPKP